MAPVGAPIMHVSADKQVQFFNLFLNHLVNYESQVTGEALYTDDIPTPPRGLYAAFVMSTKSHAEILSVDPSKALAYPGVVAYYGAKDIPGANQVRTIYRLISFVILLLFKDRACN